MLRPSHADSTKDDRRKASVQKRGPDLIGAVLRADEHFIDLRMADRIAGCIGQKILLRDIGDILGFGIFREKMIERLVLVRADLFGNRLPPFLCIREDGIDVVDYASERIFPVLDDLTNAEFRDTGFHDKGPCRR